MVTSTIVSMGSCSSGLPVDKAVLGKSVGWMADSVAKLEGFSELLISLFVEKEFWDVLSLIMVDSVGVNGIGEKGMDAVEVCSFTKAWNMLVVVGDSDVTSTVGGTSAIVDVVSAAFVGVARASVVVAADGCIVVASAAAVTTFVAVVTDGDG